MVQDSIVLNIPMLKKKNTLHIFHECNSFVYLSVTILMIVSFLVFSPSYMVSVSCSFLLSFCFFGTLSFMPKIFFRYVGSYLRQWKTVWKLYTCALGFVIDCGFHCSIIWVGLFFFFSWENPILYIFTFSLCWLRSPGMDPWSPVRWHLEGICLAPRNSWVEGKFLTIWHIKCLLLPQLSLWNPPVTWTGSSSLYPLLYQI